MLLEYELYNFMFDTARIGHENTYDMRAILSVFCFYVSLNAEP